MLPEPAQKQQGGEGKEKLYSQELTLPAYDSPDNVFIVFLEGHKAELVVGGGYPGEPGWMGSVKGGTLGACLRAHDRAHCYKNLPHYDNDEDNFAEWTRHDCRHILSGHPEKAISFAFTKQECLDWERDCLAGISDKQISNKEMCKIDWRSPIFGE